MMFHIVTLFPDLLNYGFYASLLLRVVLAVFAITFGFSIKNILYKGGNVLQTSTTDSSGTTTSHKNSTHYFIKSLFVIAGILVLIGFYTQVATMLLSLLFIVALAKPSLVTMEGVSKAELILLLVISLAMIILPAGYFAIDYPL